MAPTAHDLTTPIEPSRLEDRQGDSKTADPLPAWQIWIGIGVAWFLWGMISALRLAAIPEGLSWSQAFWYGFPDAVIWAALTPFLLRIARHHPIRRERLVPSLIFHLLSATGFAILHAGLDAGASTLRGLLSGSQEVSWTFIFFKVLLYGFHTNLLVYTLVIGLAHYVERVRRLAEGERRAAKLEAQLNAARLAGLERQLRPHFLFNALNTIASLMGEDSTTGRRVVRRLGDLLRASLKNPGRRIPLSEEISLVHAYLEIEQARFEKARSVELDVDSSLLGYKVPALILQPLVENAITHGIAHRPEGGSLRVAAKVFDGDLVLVVEDDGPGLPETAAEPKGFGVGLRNTNERLQTLYGDHEREYLTLKPGGASNSGDGKAGLQAILRLPLSGDLR